MKPTKQIAQEVVKGTNKDITDLYKFVDFIKTNSIALKIAFRCDRQVAWELLRTFLREFEKIGMYMRRYDERVDEIAQRIKNGSSIDPLNKRLENILEEAEKLKGELEQYHLERARRRRKRTTNNSTHEV